MLRRGIFISLLCVFANAHAYDEADQSKILVKLNPTWKAVGQTDDGNVSLAAYMNAALGANKQTILKTASKKIADKPADDQVLQLYGDMRKRLTSQGCDVAALQAVKMPDTLFREWDTSFNCKAPMLSGSMIIVDADAKNIYTFTFNTNDSSYNAAASTEAITLLRESMQLCYTGKSCYVI